MAEEDKNISPRILALVCLDMPITEQNVENTLTSKDLESKKKLHPLVRRALRIALNYGAMHLDDGNYNLHFICHTQLKVAYQPKQEPSKVNECLTSEQLPLPSPPTPTTKKTKSIENIKSNTKRDIKQISKRKKRGKKKKIRKLKKPICSSLCISSNNTNSSNRSRIKNHLSYRRQRQRNTEDSTETPSYCSTIKKPTRKKKRPKQSNNFSCCSCCGQRRIKKRKQYC